MALQLRNSLTTPSGRARRTRPDVMQNYSPIVRAGEKVLQGRASQERASLEGSGLTCESGDQLRARTHIA